MWSTFWGSKETWIGGDTIQYSSYRIPVCSWTCQASMSLNPVPAVLSAQCSSFCLYIWILLVICFSDQKSLPQKIPPNNPIKPESLTPVSLITSPYFNIFLTHIITWNYLSLLLCIIWTSWLEYKLQSGKRSYPLCSHLYPQHQTQYLAQSRGTIICIWWREKSTGYIPIPVAFSKILEMGRVLCLLIIWSTLSNFICQLGWSMGCPD